MAGDKQCPKGMGQVKKTALNIRGVPLPVYQDAHGTLKELSWPLLQCTNSEWSFTEAGAVLKELRTKGVYPSDGDRSAAANHHAHTICFPKPTPIQKACERLAANR